MDGYGMMRAQKPHKRFKVLGGTFVVLKPQNHSSRLGNIIDISRKGLSFQYPINCNLCFKNFLQVDIYVSGDGLYVSEIPIKVISDISITPEDPFFSTTMKRFGVQFGKLTVQQKSLLESFIHSYTASFVQDRRKNNNKLLEKRRRWYDTLESGTSEEPQEKNDRRSRKERRKPQVVVFSNASSHLDAYQTAPQLPPDQF